MERSTFLQFKIWCLRDSHVTAAVAAEMAQQDWEDSSVEASSVPEGHTCTTLKGKAWRRKGLRNMTC